MKVGLFFNRANCKENIERQIQESENQIRCNIRVWVRNNCVAEDPEYFQE